MQQSNASSTARPRRISKVRGRGRAMEPPTLSHGLSGGGKQSVSPSPRVVSVRRAKVAQLTVSGLDLSACRFAGAHGLDLLRVERARFAQPPEPKRRLARGRWTRRQTIAEEHHWRSDPSKDAQGWYGAQVRPPEWLEDTETPPDPGQIAAVYRALRKGFEDNRDEPGAGDFYYGEMEMRRDAARTTVGGERRATSLGERLVLWLYWLVAGYGLRTSRALIALAVTILIAAIPLAQWGIDPPRTSTNVTSRLSTQPHGRMPAVSQENRSDSPSYGRAVLLPRRAASVFCVPPKRTSQPPARRLRSCSGSLGRCSSVLRSSHCAAASSGSARTHLDPALRLGSCCCSVARLSRNVGEIVRLVAHSWR
jgi:hypothetical protein